MRRLRDVANAVFFGLKHILDPAPLQKTAFGGVRKEDAGYGYRFGNYRGAKYRGAVYDPDLRRHTHYGDSSSYVDHNGCDDNRRLAHYKEF